MVPSPQASVVPFAMPSPDRTAPFGELADAILANPLDRAELDMLAARALRIHVQAQIQARLWKAEDDPGDEVLLTPEEVSQETGASLYSVREAIRQKRLATWKPHPKAVRNLKIQRKAARVWAGRA